LGRLVKGLTAGVDPLDDDVNSNRVRNLAELKILLVKLKDIIHEQALEGESNLPAFQFEPTPIPDGVILSDSVWLKLLFKAGSSREKVKQKMLEEYREYVDKFIGRTVKHLSRDPMLDLIENALATNENMVNKAIDLLAKAEEKLLADIEAADLTGRREHYNIVEIAEPGYSERLTSQFNRLEAGARTKLLSEILESVGAGGASDKAAGWDDLLTRASDEIAGIMKYPYFLWALKEKGEWNIAQEALKRFTSAADLKSVVTRSFPYCQMKSDYHSLRPSINVQLERICGKGIPERLAELANHELGQQRPFEVSSSSLDNVVVLYREEAPFHIDDMYAHEPMVTQYNKYMSRSDTKPLHTEIDPDVFDKTPLAFLNPIRDKLEAIRLLYPDEIFESAGNDMVYKFMKYDGLTNYYEVTSESDREEFCAKLSRKDPESEAARKAFDNDVQKLLNEYGREKVANRINGLKAEWHNSALQKHERDERVQKVEALYAEVFSGESN
jgi:hypothetical protein